MENKASNSRMENLSKVETDEILVQFHKERKENIEENWHSITGFILHDTYKRIIKTLDESVQAKSASWVTIPEDHNIKSDQKSKILVIENLTTRDIWELAEPSESSKGHFICLGKSPPLSN